MTTEDDHLPGESWRLKANCIGVDPRLLVPPAVADHAATQRLTGLAKRAGAQCCPDCEVKVECEDFRASHNIWVGVWGGKYYAGDRTRTRLAGGASLTWDPSARVRDPRTGRLTRAL